MSTQSGGKLRPETRKKQRTGFVDSKVWDTLGTMWRMGLLASKGAFNRVLRWFSNLATGSEVDLRTPFFADKVDGKLVYRPQDQIVADFQPALSEVLAQNDDLGDALREWEEDQAHAVGPQSQFSSWFVDGPKKAAAVFSDKPRSEKVDKRAYDQAMEEVAALIPRQSVHLSSLADAINGARGDGTDGMDGTTNSGLPYAVSPWWYEVMTSAGLAPRHVSQDTVECSEYLVREAQRLLPILGRKELQVEDLPYLEALSGQRLVQKGMEPYSLKSKRLVVAMPKIDAILGRMALIGIVEKLRSTAFRGHVLLAAWNPAWFVDQAVQRLLIQADKEGRTILSGDISSFDATIPPYVLEDVGRVVASWVRGGEALVNNLVRMVIYRTRLWTPSGPFGPGPSSMKSGSWFTSLGGSLSNTFLQLYGEKLGLYKIEGLLVLGDDFDMDGPGVSAQTTSDTFAHFGMEANPSKQFVVPKHALFLQRFHTLGRIGGIASCNRTLGSCLSLEKLAVRSKEWNKYAYVVQALAKLQNTAFHPAHKALIEYVAGGDSLELGRNMLPDELIAAAGTAGEKVLGDEAHKPWKSQGSGTSFVEWTSNGVLRGEVLPPAGDALWQRVYGRVPYADGTVF